MSASSYFKGIKGPKPGPKLTARIKSICPHVFLVCYRKVNKNVICWSVNLDENGDFVKDNPIVPFWLDVDPAYASKNKSDTDRVELNDLDLFAWGFKTSVSESKKMVCFYFDNFPGLLFNVMVGKSGKAMCTTTIDKRLYNLSSLYIDISLGVVNSSSSVIKSVFKGKLDYTDNVNDLYVNAIDIGKCTYNKKHNLSPPSGVKIQFVKKTKSFKIVSMRK